MRNFNEGVEVSKLISELMQKKGMTVKELSEASGLSVRQVKKLLNQGYARISIVLIDAVSRGLGMTSPEFFTVLTRNIQNAPFTPDT